MAGSVPLSPLEFDALFERLQRQVRWGPSDRRGALNHITTARVVEAAAEVRSGHSVSLAAPVETGAAADNPTPTRHQMTGATYPNVAATGLDLAFDWLAFNIHGNADSHIDALSHVSYDARLYNDVPASVLTPEGAEELSIEVAAERGIVGRGVLLDIPRLRGVPWLEPGDDVSADDLARAERALKVCKFAPGDLLFVRVGHRRRRNQLGASVAAAARAGLHPSALEFVAERRVGLLGGDGNNDTAPAASSVAFPVHVLAINALGLHLLDYLQFEDLGSVCEAEQRWSFLCVIAPLRLPKATGSPVNPIAIF